MLVYGIELHYSADYVFIPPSTAAVVGRNTFLPRDRGVSVMSHGVTHNSHSANSRELCSVV